MTTKKACERCGALCMHVYTFDVKGGDVTIWQCPTDSRVYCTFSDEFLGPENR